MIGDRVVSERGKKVSEMEGKREKKKEFKLIDLNTKMKEFWIIVWPAKGKGKEKISKWLTAWPAKRKKKEKCKWLTAWSARSKRKKIPKWLTAWSARKKTRKRKKMYGEMKEQWQLFFARGARVTQTER
jgi:hypothetical protein